jgi:hypothetical protein
MDAPKGRPALFLGPRAGLLQRFGVGAGRKGKDDGQSPTVLPFGFPPFRRAPEGLPGRNGASLDLLLTPRVTCRAEGLMQQKLGARSHHYLKIKASDIRPAARGQMTVD